jgi:hypothetical protein
MSRNQGMPWLSCFPSNNLDSFHCASERFFVIHAAVFCTVIEIA